MHSSVFSWLTHESHVIKNPTLSTDKGNVLWFHGSTFVSLCVSVALKVLII